MASQGQITLYGALICPYVQRVRAALEYLQVPYNYEEVDLLTNQHQQPWYTAINPCQKVPTIRHNDNLIFESLVILEYLQEVYGQGQNGRSLYPNDFDAAKRALVRIWVRVFEDRVLNNQAKVYQLLKANDKDGLHETVKILQSGLKYVAKHSGLTQRLAAIAPGEQQYFWGKELSLADFAFIPNLNSLVTLLKLGAKIDLFESIEETDKEDLQAFGTWFAYAVQNQYYQQATYRLTSLPPTDRNSILAENSWTSPQQWNYQQFWQLAMAKRFGIQTEA